MAMISFKFRKRILGGTKNKIKEGTIGALKISADHLIPSGDESVFFFFRYTFPKSWGITGPNLSYFRIYFKHTVPENLYPSSHSSKIVFRKLLFIPVVRTKQ